MKNRNELMDDLILKAKEKNIEEFEVYMKNTSSMNCNIYEGAIEKYSVADEEVLSLRGIYDGKMGYAYTEKFTPESIDELLENLKQYAENNDNEYIESIAEPFEIDIKSKTNTLDNYSEEEKIEYLLDLEKRAYGLDEKVKRISGCSYNEIKENIFIKNTKGLELEDTHFIGNINLGAVAELDGNMQTGYSHVVFNELSEDFKEDLIEESVGYALSMLGAKSIKAGKYKVIFKNDVAADMFSSFLPMFAGDVVQQNLSALKGKIDSKIAVDFFNIVEDPMMELGKTNRSFDDEGSLTSKKHIVEKGVLKTFLHNKRSAEKDGLESTGNGFRQSHKSSIGIMPTNLYIEKGQKSYDELITTMDKGIIITEIHGLHAGINPTSGDYSLSSAGYLVEDGKIVRPVSQITVAGNLYETLLELEEIGSDTAFCHPGMDYFGSPSLLVKSLNISGK